MSNRAGGNTRAAKYDYLIKLLLIGDSGAANSITVFVPCLSYRYNMKSI